MRPTAAPMTRLRFAAPIIAAVALLGISSQPVFGQNSPEDILRTLNYRRGSITLGDNLATINLKEGFRYLDNADTQTFLTKVWANPPGAGSDSLGMLVSAAAHPLSDEAYAIILSYEATGYVSDEDAEKGLARLVARSDRNCTVIRCRCRHYGPELTQHIELTRT